MTPSRRRLSIAVAAGLALWTAQFAEAQSGAAPGCLSRERIECGCMARLTSVECPSDAGSSRYHLYSGLTDGSPLWIKLDGQEVELDSGRPPAQSFSFSEGNSWTETYTRADVSVAVSYRPGRSTCRQAPPETCEYFDVQASVTIQRDKYPPLRYEGVGGCGC